MLSRDEIIDFFKLENSHAKKELGQNFLINKNIAIEMCNFLELNKNDNLLEIGPGLGALTDILINRTLSYTAIEYDAKFINYLSLAYKDTNLILKKQNILKNQDFEFNKIIGNLPYYITTDIIESIALKYKNLDIGIFMIQKEAYNRITAKQGKDYNALNILLMYMFDINKLFDVSKDNYFPIPTVNSIVFKMVPKREKNRAFASILYKIARISFINRRKTLFNNLKVLTKDSELLTKMFKDLDMSLLIRPEEVSLNLYEKITLYLLNVGVIKL